MSDFICKKSWPSLVLQAVVDSDYMFLGVYYHTPRSTHDGTVYLRSPLFDSLSRKMPQNDKLIQVREVQLHLLCDPAHPISPYIIKRVCGSVPY